MKLCQALFLLATLLALATLPFAQDTDAQQFCPRNANVMTIQKQQQTTGYYQQIQQQKQQQVMQQQQQQQYLIQDYQRQQTAIAKTTTPVKKTSTPIQQTATQYLPQTTAQIQKQQQVIHKSEVAIQHTPGMICSKTSPQILTTQQTIAKTNTQINKTTTPVECTLTQIKTTQQPIAKTNVAIHQTTTPYQRTVTDIKKSTTTIEKTATTITKTPIQMAKTETETKVYVNINCMQCHHQQPTGVTTVEHKMPQLHQVPKVNPLPQLVQRPPQPLPGAVYPMVPGQPLVTAKLPGYLRPPLLPIDTAKVQPLPVPVATMSMPSLKNLDLPALLGTPDKTRPKMDPLIATVTFKQPAGGDKLPTAVVELSTDLMPRKSALFDHLRLEDRGLPINQAEEMGRTLSDEDFLLPPTRQLTAAVIQLPPLPLVVEVLENPDELLPPLPASAGPLAKRDPRELFAPAGQPTPGSAIPLTPLPNPTLIQPGLPTNRSTDLGPG